jgi:energy-coupling factor transport system ATP-binding protein
MKSFMNVIELKNVSYFYRQEEGLVVKDMSFSVQQGEWVTILGPNGSGKSTLSKLIIGLMATKEGEITIQGEKVEPNAYDIRQRVGMVFQNPDNQFVGSTVKDDIAFGLENKQLTREEMEKRIQHYADLVGLTSLLEKEPHNLSGGEKQRVAMASVLALETDIIILDEATSMLDPLGRAEVLASIRQLKGMNKTVLSITHDVTEALLADRVVVLDEGSIIAQGTVEEIFSQPEVLQQARLDVLPSMKLIQALQAKGYDNQEVFQLLWRLPFNK